MSCLDDSLIQTWESLQLSLASKADLTDSRCGFDPSRILGNNDMSETLPELTLSSSSDTDSGLPPLRWIGGLDISFVKDTNIAVASLVVLDAFQVEPFPVIYEDFLQCTIDVPYIPGFLACREVEPLRELIRRIKERAPQFLPQVYFIDSNGVLHPRKCGLATHLGVLEDMPIVGCAKNLLAVDGLELDSVKKLINSATANPSSHPGTFSFRNVPLIPLVGTSGFLYGYCALTGSYRKQSNSSSKAIYISSGNLISPRLAALLAVRLAWFRVVEPVRQADQRSRKYIAENLTNIVNE